MGLRFFFSGSKKSKSKWVEEEDPAGLFMEE